MNNLEIFKNPIVESSTTKIEIKISESLANIIRENTKCPKDKLKTYLTNDNVFNYYVALSEDMIDDIMILIKTIEDISNSVDEETFIKHILYSDSKNPNPVNVHKMMEEEYNLEGNIEWYTSLFFINLSELIVAPEFYYRSIEQDKESDDCVVLKLKKRMK